MAMIRAGHYVVADLVGLPEASLAVLRNVGPTALDDLRQAVTALAKHPIAARDAAAVRAGTSLDPQAPPFGESFGETLATVGLNPESLSLVSLNLGRISTRLLVANGFGTVAQLRALRNVDLLRRVRSTGPDLLEEFQRCAEAFGARHSTRPSASWPGGRDSTVVGQADSTLDAPTDALLWLLAAVDGFDERWRLVLTMRLGLDGSPMTLEAAGGRLGVTRERVRQIEKKALDALRSARQPATAAFDDVSAIREGLGLAWEDDRLLHAVTNRRSHPVWANPGHLQLLKSLYADRIVPDDGLSDVEAAVVVALATGRPKHLAELTEDVLTLLDDDEVARFPSLSLSDRIALLGPAVQMDDGRYRLPAEPITGVNDRRIRRLSAIRRVLEEHGPQHYSTIAQGIESLLPPDLRLSERDVHAWLQRHPKLFVWAGRGIYGLTSHGVGASQAGDNPQADGADGRSRRRGIGDEIEAMLIDRGPLPLEQIQGHILSRFLVNESSVLATILQDGRRRFQYEAGRPICLSAESRAGTATEPCR